MKKKGLLVLLIVVVSICVVGCGKKKERKIPDIVFLYTHADENGEHPSAMFIDKEGNYVACFDEEIATLSYDQLVETYKTDKSKFEILRQVCTPEQISEQYKKIIKLSESKDLQLVYESDVAPDVITDSSWLYVLYCDENDQCCIISLQYYNVIYQYITDETGKELIRWYNEIIKL